MYKDELKEQIETEKKADIDKLTESIANAMYESIRRNKKAVM